NGEMVASRETRRHAGGPGPNRRWRGVRKAKLRNRLAARRAPASPRARVRSPGRAGPKTRSARRSTAPQLRRSGEHPEQARPRVLPADSYSNGSILLPGSQIGPGRPVHSPACPALTLLFTARDTAFGGGIVRGVLARREE